MRHGFCPGRAFINKLTQGFLIKYSPPILLLHEKEKAKSPATPLRVFDLLIEGAEHLKTRRHPSIEEFQRRLARADPKHDFVYGNAPKSDREEPLQGWPGKPENVEMEPPTNVIYDKTKAGSKIAR